MGSCPLYWAKKAASKETQNRQDLGLAWYFLSLSSSVRTWLQVAETYVSKSAVNYQLLVQLSTLWLFIFFQKIWPAATAESIWRGDCASLLTASLYWAKSLSPLLPLHLIFFIKHISRALHQCRMQRVLLLHSSRNWFEPNCSWHPQAHGN